MGPHSQDKHTVTHSEQKELALHKNVVALLTLVALLALSACAPVQSPAAEAPAAEQAPAVIYTSAADIPRLGVSEAKAHFDEGTAVFVDSRSRTFYDMEHIAGALPPPEAVPPALDNSIPKDQLIITYCT
jgi:hypothetical protein